MLLRTLDYEEQFRCLAGRCPHSCCVGWEVMLDEDHARRYLAGDDPLSRRAAEAMVYDEEEDAFAFPLSGGRCPFLDGEDLCELHRAWGAEATPLTCQTHPRFTEDYGPFAERALSAACPAANARLLGSREPLGFRESETGEPGEEGDEWLPYLVPFRRRLFEALRDRSRPLRARLADFLGHDFGELVKTEACLADRPRHWRDFVTGADGVYLIGEAAGFISASSFEGISSAIRSGSALADAFRNVENASEITKSYRKKTFSLRCKLFLKIWKRWFMYTPWVRSLIMRSGIESIRVRRSKED